jgi:hypothetical protein
VKRVRQSEEYRAKGCRQGHGGHQKRCLDAEKGGQVDYGVRQKQSGDPRGLYGLSACYKSKHIHRNILWNERECKRPEKSVVFKNEGIYGEGSACIGAIRVQFLEKISNIEGFAKHAEILTALVCGAKMIVS